MTEPTASIEARSNVVKFPYKVSRRAFARQRRSSDNGTPEEREKVAAGVIVSAPTDDSWFHGFAQRLRETRSDLGISEEEAAAAAGVSVPTWRKYETTGDGRNMTYKLKCFLERYDAMGRLGFLLGEPPASTGVALRPPARGETAGPRPVKSEIGGNKRLRRDRKSAWRKAETKLEYWRAYRNLHSTINRANDYEVLDELGCPAPLRYEHGNFATPWVLDHSFIQRIHAAEVELLLTPSPDVASLNWKRKRIEHQWYQTPDADIEYLRLHSGRKQSPFGDIKQAIADDETWLSSHPARQCKANKRRGATEGGADA